MQSPVESDSVTVPSSGGVSREFDNLTVEDIERTRGEVLADPEERLAEFLGDDAADREYFDSTDDDEDDSS